MSRRSSVSAVTLDAHGVLLLPDPAALRCALAPFDVHPDDDTCRRVHFKMVNLIDRYVEPNWHEVRQSMAAAFGLSGRQVDEAAPIVAEVYLNEPWIAAPGAKDSIGRLVSSDHSLAVVANSTHGQVERWLADAGLCSIVGPLPKVACVLDSHVVGFAKPDRRIFEMALSNLGIPPMSACMSATRFAEIASSLLREQMRSQVPGFMAELATWIGVDDIAWAQRYAVTTLCRMLFTVRHGTLASKRRALLWAAEGLDPRWRELVLRAERERVRGWDPSDLPERKLVEQTRQFAAYATQWVVSPAEDIAFALWASPLGLL